MFMPHVKFGMRNKKCARKAFSACLLALIMFVASSRSFADDSLSASGRLGVRGVSELNEDSVQEDPSVTGRLKLDTDGASWKFHSWLEGGWDGAVRRPTRDNSLFKSFDEVYQDNNPYLEVKELYVEHSFSALDLKAGIQRFAWGRLDEYPSNDLLNPWDYTQFLRKPLEDRKIGVPSVSASVNSGDWTYQTVWLPWLVPYRLPKPNERWAGASVASALTQVPGAEIIPQEPDLPPRTIENSSIGLRILRQGEIEWAVNLFHGYDPRPVFRTTSLVVTSTTIDPGYVPSFHRITSLGVDAASVRGDWSIRAEAAYTFNRFFNVRPELWGYPLVPVTKILNPIEIESDTLDYGAGADYRPFEDGLVTIQAQQTVIFDRTDGLYERKFETILWANLKVGWMNQKVETNLAVAYNPEHGSHMTTAKAYYTFTDFWKAGVTAVFFNGPPLSLFGRYAMNDQVEAELVCSW